MSDYPVSCPAGTELDEACAESKKKSFDEAIKALNDSYRDSIKATVEIHRTAIQQCNGSVDCINAANATLADRVNGFYDWYNERYEEISENYHNSLAECCKEKERSLWDIISGWF